MKRILPLFLLLLLSTSSFSKKRIVEYYDKEWGLTSKENAAFFKEIEYDNATNAPFALRYYYISGKIQNDGRLLPADSTKYEGANVWYFENGKKQREQSFKNGKLEGKAIHYFAGGNKYFEANYTDGRLNGECLYYYTNGQIRSSANYKNGVRSGQTVYYSFAGAIESKAMYKNNKLEGEQTEYNAYGGLKSIEKYSDNRQNGVQKTYHANGKIAREENYKKGVLNGKSTQYFESGVPAYQATYKNNVLNGMETGFYDNGNVESRKTYKNGSLNGKAIWYHKNGLIWQTMNYKNGRPEGEKLEYHDNGQVYYLCNFKNGRLDGKFTSFYPDGKVFRQGAFKDGREEGEFIKNGEDGYIERTTYRAGLKQKETTYFQSFGTKIKEWFYFNDGKFLYREWNRNGKLVTERSYNSGRYKSVSYDKNGKVLKEVLPDSVLLLLPVKSNANCQFGFENLVKEQYPESQEELYTENERYYIVGKSRLYGVMDYKGEIIIPMQYKKVEMLQYLTERDSLAGVTEDDDFICPTVYFRVSDGNSKWGLIDTNNEPLIPIEYDYLSNIVNHFMILKKNDMFGFADMSGKVFPLKYKSLNYFNRSGIALFSDLDLTGTPDEQKRYGAINTQGNVIVPCQFSWINTRKTYNLIWVANGEKMGAYSTKGARILAPEYDKQAAVNFKPYELAVLTKDGKSHIIRSNGSVAGVFDSIRFIDYGAASGNLPVSMALASNGEQWSVIDKNVRTLIPADYEGIQAVVSYRRGTQARKHIDDVKYVVKQNGKYGIINDANNLLVPLNYNFAYIKKEKDAENATVFLLNNVELKAYNAADVNQSLDIAKALGSNEELINFCLPNEADSTAQNCKIVTPDGKVFFPSEYETSIASENYIKYTQQGKPGVMSKGRESILPFGMFAEIGAIAGDYVPVITYSQKAGLYDLSKKAMAVDTIFDAVATFDKHYDDYVWVKAPFTSALLIAAAQKPEEDHLSGNWGLMHTASQGKVLEAVYDFPTTFKDSVAVIYKDSYKGIVRQDGRVVLPCYYKLIERQADGSYLINEDDLWGIADAQGNVVVQPQWGDMTGFLGKHAPFWLDGKVGITDTQGNIEVKPEAEDFSQQKIPITNYLKFSREGLPIAGYRLIADYFATHPNEAVQTKVTNTLLGYALREYVFSREQTFYSFPYRHEPTVNYTFNFSYAKAKKLENATMNDYSERQFFRSSTAVLGITRRTLSFANTVVSGSAHSKGAKTQEKQTEYYNYEIKPDGSLKPIHFTAMFNAKTRYKVVLNELICREIDRLKRNHILCNDQKHYFDLLQEDFAITPKGLTFFLNQTLNLTQEKELIFITIPFSDLLNIADTKGVLWDLVQ